MDKNSLVLATLASSKASSFSPVQLQKMFFLIDRNISDLIGGTHFNFRPYDYGPFDEDVYSIVEALNRQGLVEVAEVSGRSWKKYYLTESGQLEGEKTLSTFPPKAKAYVENVSKFVLSLSFAELVSAIYKAYPEMKENSVFGK